MKTRKPKPQREPLVKAGTTAHWQRPICGKYEIAVENAEVDLLEVLVKTCMAQSRAEARRLIKQGIVWSMDEDLPRKLTDYKFRPFFGGRLIVGMPEFVDMGDRGMILDLTKGVIVLFVKNGGKV